MLLLLPRVAEIRDETASKAFSLTSNITLVSEIAKTIPIDNSLHVTYQ